MKHVEKDFLKSHSFCLLYHFSCLPCFFFFFFCNCSAYLPFCRGVSIRLIFFPGCLYFCLRFFCLSLSLFFGPIYPCLFFSAWLSLSQFVIIFFLAVSMAISFLCQSIALSVFFILLSLSRPVFFSDCLLSLTLFKGFLYGCLMFFAVSNYLIFQTVSLYLSLFVSECLYLCLLFGHFYPYLFWLSIIMSVYFFLVFLYLCGSH